MLNASKLVRAGKGLAGALLKRAAGLELDWQTRQQAAFEAVDSSGRQIRVVLPQGSVLQSQDVLVAEDGTLIRVQAAPQAVMVARTCPQHGRPSDLARAAYILGRANASVEVHDDHLAILPDAVLARMLDEMHLIVTEERRSFEPSAAGLQAGTHGHHACREAAHHHTHSDAHAHDHRPRPGHGHTHGPGCDHHHDDH